MNKIIPRELSTIIPFINHSFTTIKSRVKIISAVTLHINTPIFLTKS